jgi:alpha-glucosidase
MLSPRVNVFFFSLILGFTIAGVRACTQVGATSSAEIRSFSKVTHVEPIYNGIEIHDGELTMRVTALRDDILRIRASRTATLPEDASWAVLANARSTAVAVQQDRAGNAVGFHTKKLRISVDRANGIFTLLDVSDNVLQKDAEPLQFQGDHFRIAQTMPADEHYFGLGDKTGAFDRREQAFRMWNTDAYGWQESTDPIYKSIPFYLTDRAGISFGVLIDNTWPSSFDFGKTLGGIFQYCAEGGPVDMYVLYGPTAKQVLAGYAWLTGPTPLPPLWSLGFQQSRYSYMTQARVLEVADRLRRDKVPSDAIYLDIDYQEKNRPFTIDKNAFPDMPGLIKTLHEDKFHVVAITDLHIAYSPNQNYAPYDSGAAGNHFLKDSEGSLYVGPVWPGPSVFPDFTQRQSRAWWGTLYTNFTAIGIDGFWNDMNEPSVFDAMKTMPCSVVHHIDEPGFAHRSATHCEIHNVYGMENSRATFEGQLTLKPDTRPFVLTRATYAGGQRYAATWTGDDSATWNHLRLTTSMLKNLGLSGFALAGADVGGYAGTPSAELLTKWIEIAAFQPIDRDHAEKGTGDHEVWANGLGQEAIRRHFIEERYKLLPYLYTVTEDNTHDGLPLLRPLFLEFPNAAADRHPLDVDLPSSGEFMVGPDLLVAAAPFLEKIDDYDATLPSLGWYDYWTGQLVEVARQRVVSGDLLADAAKAPPLPAVRIHPELASLPVFVRPGAILPIAPLVQSTAERPNGPLTLRVFPGSHCAGHLYQDDGLTFAYKHGDFLRMNFTCEISSDRQLVNIHIGKHEGIYPAWWHQIVVEVNGLSKKPSSIMVDDHAATFTADDHSATVTVPDEGNGIDIAIP